MRVVFFVFYFFLSVLITPAQELKCTVQVLFDQVGGTDVNVYQNLKTSVLEFMNSTRWTKDVMQDQERIECSILINVEKRLSTEEFEGSIQIQSRRPVYKSSYNTIVLNHKDKDFQFRYLPSEPFEYSENIFLSNLTSVLAYYAYMVIGYDYDSYALNGGSQCFQKAQLFVTNAQNVGFKGWKAAEDTKNRYWLVDNVLSPNFSPIREAIYKYHRLGLDMMSTNKEAGRKAIMESLELLRQINKQRPNSFNMQVFFNAKGDELINIFSQAALDEKNKAVNLLSEINPANSNKYQKILSAGN